MIQHAEPLDRSRADGPIHDMLITWSEHSLQSVLKLGVPACCQICFFAIVPKASVRSKGDTCFMTCLKTEHS